MVETSCYGLLVLVAAKIAMNLLLSAKQVWSLTQNSTKSTFSQRGTKQKTSSKSRSEAVILLSRAYQYSRNSRQVNDIAALASPPECHDEP